MNKRIDYSNLGGFPATQKTFDFMQTSYRGALSGLASLCGSKVILTGVQVVGPNVTGGWIVYNGEMIPFVGGGYSPNVVIEETAESVTFQDNAVRDVYYTKTAKCGTPGTFPFSDLKKLNTIQELRWLPGDLKQVNCDAAYIEANFDASGNGINERAGWKICNAMGGRVAVGYSTVDIDPGDNVWDAIYNIIGATAGEKKHLLTGAESGVNAHDHEFTGSGDQNGTLGIRLFAGQQPQRLGSTFSPNEDNTVRGDTKNADVAHENRQPFKVILYIEKL